MHNVRFYWEKEIKLQLLCPENPMDIVFEVTATNKIVGIHPSKAILT